MMSYSFQGSFKKSVKCGTMHNVVKNRRQGSLRAVWVTLYWGNPPRREPTMNECMMIVIMTIISYVIACSVLKSL